MYHRTLPPHPCGEGGLLRQIKELEDGIAACMRCGLCQAVCPLFAETGREADVARGKLALLDALGREMVRDAAGVEKILSRCLLCGSCAANCPSGVTALDIFFKARLALASYLGLGLFSKALIKSVLADPARFDRIMRFAAWFQGIFLKPLHNLPGVSRLRFFPGLLSRHVRPLSPKPFHRYARAAATGPRKLRVAFFVGCLIDKVFPNIAEDAMRVLSLLDVEVLLPDQGCCGIPELSLGDAAAFHRLARYHLARFGNLDVDYVVTACATCAFTIRKLWPAMLSRLTSRERDTVHNIAGKTLEISQFLVDEVGLPRLGSRSEDKIATTYHDPCHLKKSLGVTAQPRAMIEANPRYVLKEMDEADRCCGCGGSFNLKHYPISARIGKRKAENIRNSGCRVVATACPACMIQLSDALSHLGLPIAVKHPIEIYAQDFWDAPEPRTQNGD